MHVIFALSCSWHLYFRLLNISYNICMWNILFRDKLCPSCCLFFMRLWPFHLVHCTSLQQCSKSWHWDGGSFFDENEKNKKYINVVWQLDIDLQIVYQQGALFATLSCSPISLHSSGARWWTVCPRFPVGELWVPWDVLFILLGSVLWMQSREG